MGCYQWAITIGLFVAAIVLNSTKDRNDTGSYRIPVAVQFAWAIILVVGMLILPETPRYLIKRGRQDQAAKSLSRLRRLDVNHPALVEELAEIQANHEYEMLIGENSLPHAHASGRRFPSKNNSIVSISLQCTSRNGLLHRLLPKAYSQASPHWLCPSSSAATHWCELYILLWHILLPTQRHLEPLHYLRHHRCRQCLLYRAWPISRRKMGPSPSLNVWCHRHVGCSTHRCFGWHCTPKRPYQ